MTDEFTIPMWAVAAYSIANNKIANESELKVYLEMINNLINKTTPDEIKVASIENDISYEIIYFPTRITILQIKNVDYNEKSDLKKLKLI